jgi:hypothetical protein
MGLDGVCDAAGSGGSDGMGAGDGLGKRDGLEERLENTDGDTVG